MRQTDVTSKSDWKRQLFFYKILNKMEFFFQMDLLFKTVYNNGSILVDVSYRNATGIIIITLLSVRAGSFSCLSGTMPINLQLASQVELRPLSTKSTIMAAVIFQYPYQNLLNILGILYIFGTRIQ